MLLAKFLIDQYQAEWELQPDRKQVIQRIILTLLEQTCIVDSAHASRTKGANPI